MTKVAEEPVNYKANEELSVEKLQKEMKKAAKEIDFERAAMLRNKIREISEKG